MSDFEKLINASDLIKWIVTAYPDWYMGAIRDIYDHIVEMPSAQQWIPCSERMPEEGIVLVTYRDRDVDILRYPTAYRKYDIIAWMPIEPWRGEEHE